MLKDAPGIREDLVALKDFCGNAILAAHNAPFDLALLTLICKNVIWIGIMMLLIH